MTRPSNAVQRFIYGLDKYCLVCSATKPCELQDDPHSPCTFDPAPLELYKERNQLRRQLTKVAQFIELQRTATCKEAEWASGYIEACNDILKVLLNEEQA